jgi:hypothetical protein
MKSLRLLAFGSSLASGRDVVGRFRMREECLLPHFGGEAASGPEPRAGTPDAGPSWWRRLGGLFRAAPRPATRGVDATPDLAPAVPAVEAKPGPQTPAVADQPGQEQSGIIFYNPFRKEAPESKPRQAEFRFANVTVVCNDLHDADFEIVPAARSRRQAPPRVEPEMVAQA